MLHIAASEPLSSERADHHEQPRTWTDENDNVKENESEAFTQKRLREECNSRCVVSRAKVQASPSCARAGET